MEKVILPRDVAEAIEGLLRLGKDKCWIINAANGEGVGTYASKIREFASEDTGNFDILLSALVNGYTVEQTPEEMVWEYFESEMKSLLHHGKYDGAYYHGSTSAIKFTLDLLGIKIEGVNA